MAEKKVEEMTLKEFMEWIPEQYDGIQYLLPSDYEHTINRLEGYCAAKLGQEDYYLLKDALNHLICSRSFFSVVKQYTDWKFK